MAASTINISEPGSLTTTVTLGPAAFSLAAESYPASVREVGMSLCVFSNMMALGIQLLVYPFITARVGYSASFCIYVSVHSAEQHLRLTREGRDKCCCTDLMLLLHG
jgi:hypothetical protein